MQFCEKCGSVMYLEEKELVCHSCGYKIELEDGHEHHRITRKIEHKPSETILVKEEGAEFENMQKTKAQCPKCGHNEAAYWFEQTRSADEPPTRFYRCVKCRQTWREYS